MQSVRLLQFTDMHLFGDAAGRLRGVASLPALQAAIADAERRCRRPEGVLLTGDLVQDDPDGYRWIRHSFGASPVPVLCLAGNHDLPDHMRATLRGAPFQVGGTSEFGRWLVVMLDSWVANNAGGRLGSEQLERTAQRTAHASQPSRAGLPAPSSDRDAQRLARPGRPERRGRIHDASCASTRTCAACCGATCISRWTVSSTACASWRRPQPAPSSCRAAATSRSTTGRPAIACSS